MNKFIIVFGFIALDYATGTVKGFAVDGFSSKKMREGLWHKASLVLVLLLAMLVDYAQMFLDLGIAVPVTDAASAYICVMEMGSVLENICIINPALMPKSIMKIFGRDTTKDKEEIK